MDQQPIRNNHNQPDPPEEDCSPLFVVVRCEICTVRAEGGTTLPEGRRTTKGRARKGGNKPNTADKTGHSRYPPATLTLAVDNIFLSRKQAERYVECRYPQAVVEKGGGSISGDPWGRTWILRQGDYTTRLVIFGKVAVVDE